MALGEIVGGELGGHGAPAERQPCPEHGRLGEGAVERMQQIGQQACRAEGDQHEREGEVLRTVRAAARGRRERRAEHAHHDQPNRYVLIAPGRLVEHALTEQHQQHQTGGKRRLHDDQGRQQQRDDL